MLVTRFSRKWVIWLNISRVHDIFSMGDHYMIHTHCHNSNLIWHTVSRRVDEVIPSDHLRRVASRVIEWYGLIHETLYCKPDQVTIMIICLLYAFF